MNLTPQELYEGFYEPDITRQKSDRRVAAALGYFHVKMGNLADAQQEFAKANERAGFDALGNVYLQHGNHDEALKCFAKAENRGKCREIGEAHMQWAEASFDEFKALRIENTIRMALRDVESDGGQVDTKQLRQELTASQNGEEEQMRYYHWNTQFTSRRSALDAFIHSQDTGQVRELRTWFLDQYRAEQAKRESDVDDSEYPHERDPEEYLSAAATASRNLGKDALWEMANIYKGISWEQAVKYFLEAGDRTAAQQTLVLWSDTNCFYPSLLNVAEKYQLQIREKTLRSIVKKITEGNHPDYQTVFRIGEMLNDQSLCSRTAARQTLKQRSGIIYGAAMYAKLGDREMCEQSAPQLYANLTGVLERHDRHDDMCCSHAEKIISALVAVSKVTGNTDYLRDAVEPLCKMPEVQRSHRDQWMNLAQECIRQSALIAFETETSA